jgi:hypothetical protein
MGKGRETLRKKRANPTEHKLASAARRWFFFLPNVTGKPRKSLAGRGRRTRGRSRQANGGVLMRATRRGPWSEGVFVSCSHCLDQQAVPCCTGRPLVAKPRSPWSQDVRRRGSCFGTLAAESGMLIGGNNVLDGIILRKCTVFRTSYSVTDENFDFGGLADGERKTDVTRG